MKTPVSQYFDNFADDYDHCYDASARPYHSYLYQQRLRNAAGGITEISPPHATFDLIFMLGVSTYLSPEVWQAVLARVTTLLAPDGRFIVSFTHPHSLDWHVRSMIRRVWHGKGVLSQSFKTFAYLPDVATHPLRLHHAERYNASLTPINTLLPRLSFWVASGQTSICLKGSGHCAALISWSFTANSGSSTCQLRSAVTAA